MLLKAFAPSYRRMVQSSSKPRVAESAITSTPPETATPYWPQGWKKSSTFVDPKLVHGVESTKQVYTPIDPPMEIKAAGHNTLFGIAQGTLLVEVRDTQDICRTVKLPIVLVPGLGRIFFSTAMAAQKGVKTVITKAGSIVDLGLFSIQLTRSDNLGFILTWLFQKKVNGQSRHLALFRENHSVRKVH